MPDEKDRVARLIQELKQKNRIRRADAAWDLGQIGDPETVPALCQALREWSRWDDAREMVRDAVTAALVKIGAPSVVPLCELLKDESPGARERAVEALGKIGDPRAVQPLCEALRDGRLWDGRYRAAEALGKIGQPSVEPLCEALRDERSAVRCLAAATLGQIGDTRAVPALCAALWDEYWPVRCLAASALGKIGDGDAIPPLCEALAPEAPELRRHAAGALGRIGDPVLPMFAAREDEDAAVRASAVEALGRIMLREPAAEALLQFGAAAVLPLCEVLKGGNLAARCQAARLLAQIAEQDPVPSLRAAVPLLRRLLALWRVRDDQEEPIFRMALERIESATAGMDLPLPAAAPPPSPEGFPIPAPPPALESNQLPIPDASPGSPRPILSTPVPEDGLAKAGECGQGGALARLAGTARRLLQWLWGRAGAVRGGRPKPG
jgi:HEAT repeat protein